jgi:hypothetical protein
MVLFKIFITEEAVGIKVLSFAAKTQLSTRGVIKCGKNHQIYDSEQQQIVVCIYDGFSKSFVHFKLKLK